MASHLSDQLTKSAATPPTMLKANEQNARVRMAYFSFTVPAGGAAISDTVSLVKIPANARLLGGHAAFEAMSTGAGDAGMQIGTADDADHYLGTTSVDAAGSASFGHTVALNYGEELTTETTLVATVMTEAWAAGKKLVGHVLYAVD